MNYNSGRLPSCLELPNDKTSVQELIQNVKDWCLMNGVGMRLRDNYNSDSITHAPFTLLPSTFPEKEFKKAVSIQPVLNELMHKVAHDYEFLKSTLKNTIEVDDFTMKLFNIYETIHEEGSSQISLGLVRSDYFLDNDVVKQVEFNTIASSFAGTASNISTLHRYVLQRLQQFDKLDKLPENLALSGICEGIVDAWKMYNNPDAIILFVVEDVTYNICDQKFHELEIYRQNPKLIVLRRSLTELAADATLSQDKKLLVKNKEVAVVYYRSGYSPDQYHSSVEWDVRLLVERSIAIKCPTIHYHLAGTKKVQQALASPSVLRKYLNDSNVDRVLETFTGLFSLDLDVGDSAIESAISNPDAYVLKPQREGGGNNVYGVEISNMLSKIRNTKERMAWILMNRIRPPMQPNYIVRPGDHCHVSANDVISELGIFGVIIGDEKNIMKNEQVGHMLRTKEHTVDEGGVAAGYGSLDSPFLI